MKYALLFAVLLLAACQSNPPAAESETMPNADNSRSSLDWAGTYRGNLPCADCPGIKTEITLLADGSYRMGMFYQGAARRPSATAAALAGPATVTASSSKTTAACNF